MQMGIISDIHGNWDALRRVWDALTQHGLADGLVLNAGDNVGYGDQPQQCVDFLRAYPNIVSVQGNYDRHVARFPERKDEFRQKWGRTRPAKLAAIQRDSARLSDEARAWLLALPRECETLWHGLPILLTHYAPGSKEGLGPWTSAAHLARLAARMTTQTGAQVVVCGHTHAPFARAAGGVLFVNPGTVGRALSGPPAYAVLSWEPPSAPEVLLAQALL